MSHNILIVEDESLVALDIASTLKKANYEVCAIANNYENAFHAVSIHRPDLILMDVYLDGHLDGIEAAKRLQLAMDSKIPIIFLTAYSDKNTLERAFQISPEGYLVKPFKREDLLTSVALALYKNSLTTQHDKMQESITLCEGYIFSPHKMQLENNGSIINMTKKESILFQLLLQNKGNFVDFSKIELEIWPDKAVSETTRRTLIHRLRSKVKCLDIKTFNSHGVMLNLE